MRDRDYYFQNTVVDGKQLNIARSRALAKYESVSFVDKNTDLTWASMAKHSDAPNQYYDYYYSGQDIQVYMAEVPTNDPEFGVMPIVSLGFNITQEKKPIYGFWNYTYSAVMRGTRLVSGQMAIVTKHPNYMRDLIARAAKARADNSGHLVDYYPAAGALTEDDDKIDQYWGKNLDSAYLNGAGNQEFSVHPPFSMVIVYGMQDPDPELHFGDTALFTDTNQRLVDINDPVRRNKIILDNCELVSCSRQYVPDGQVLVETYEFFARDCVTPQDAPPVVDNAAPVRVNKNVI